MNQPKPISRGVLGRIKTSYPRIQHLLVPLDFSGKSRQALRYAVPLAQKFSAKIHLVHVLPPGTKAERANQKQREEKALQKLDAMATELLPPRLLAGNLVMIGDPADQILAATKKFDTDLIVITTKGSSGLRRVFIGSVAEKIMRHANCPVMSVRRH